jgi:hypothetical protein
MAAAKKKELEQADMDLMAAFAQDAGEGLEDVSGQDILIPFVGILQQLSPQVNKRKPEYVEGAEPGMIYESASGTVWDGEEGIEVVPIKFMRRYTEFRPRSEGGGLVADHGSNSSILEKCVQGERGGYTTADGNELVVSGNFYCFIMDKAGGWSRVVISMSGSQLKKSRRWNTLLMQERAEGPNGKSFVPPAYYRVYHLTTVPEENDLGSWFGWKIEKSGTLLETFPQKAAEIVSECKLFKSDVGTGKAIAAQEQPQITSKGGTSEDMDDDIPF